MDRIDLLRIFARVVECASFTKAAETLGAPRSSVSAAVQELEARIGAHLLNRTTRHVAPTHDGQAFYERAVRLLGDYEETENLFRRAGAQPRGRIRIDAPGRIGRLIIAPALPDFFARYPDIEVELSVTDRAVDLTAEGVDCVIRVGPVGDDGLIARRIGDLALLNCASPSYVAARGAPSSLADLKNHLAVNYASPTSGRVDEWEHVVDGEARLLPMRSLVTVNNAEAYIACCLAGLGLIQIPAYDVAHHLAAGELVEVLPDHRAAPMPMAILYPSRRHLSVRLRAFVDWATPLLQMKILSASSAKAESPRKPRGVRTAQSKKAG